MKIENKGVAPLTTQRPDASARVEKKNNLKDVNSTRGTQDTAQMSENARLLAKARTALSNVNEADSERVAALKQQVESGDYTVQVSELARKLVTRLYPQ